MRIRNIFYLADPKKKKGQDETMTVAVRYLLTLRKKNPHLTCLLWTD